MAGILKLIEGMTAEFDPAKYHDTYTVKFQQRYQMRHGKSRDEDARWGFNLQFLSALAPSLTASFALRPGDRSESS
jgi:non-homologous end joining protein Ku